MSEGRRFLHGHNRQGTTRSPETIAKVRATWVERHDTWAGAIAAGTQSPDARRAYSRAKKGKALTPAHRAKIGAANRGKLRIDGVTYKSDGRALAYAPSHRDADEDGRVLRARVNVELSIGRYLTPKEVVHHVNFDCTDDHPDNLMVMTRSAHTALHGRIRGLRIEPHFRQWYSKAERAEVTVT